MLDVRYSTKFKKDFKACVKRRYNMDLLQKVIDILRIPDTLPQKNADHSLSGNYFTEQERTQIYSTCNAHEGGEGNE